MDDPERVEAIRSPDETPSLDLVFDVLSERRRRYALYHLREVPDGVAPVSDVVDYVYHSEGGSDGSRADLRLSIRTALQHVHLPKLENAGFIEYDERSETIRYWRQPSLDEWLEHAFYKEL